MTKVGKWHAKQRAAKGKMPSKEEKKREQFIQECCNRAKARRSNPVERKKASEEFRNSYFSSLRLNKNIANYPSLDDNTPNPHATAQRGIMALKVKLNAMDEDTRKREEAAIHEAEQRNKSIAPICNKGGYQLISKDSLHTMGRKI